MSGGSHGVSPSHKSPLSATAHQDQGDGHHGEE